MEPPMKAFPFPVVLSTAGRAVVADEGGAREAGGGDHGLQVALDEAVGLAAEVAAAALTDRGAAGEAGEYPFLVATRAGDLLGKAADLGVGLRVQGALEDDVKRSVLGPAAVHEGVPGGPADAHVLVFQEPEE